MYCSFPLSINISIAFIRQITRDAIQNVELHFVRYYMYGYLGTCNSSAIQRHIEKHCRAPTPIAVVPTDHLKHSFVSTDSFPSTLWVISTYFSIIELPIVSLIQQH